jgi:predicted PurR-regulated permease PerM
MGLLEHAVPPIFGDVRSRIAAQHAPILLDRAVERLTRTPPSPDLARVTLSVLVIGLLVCACLWILRPFLGAIVWAAMIVVATWPTMLALQARLGGRRGAAIAIMTLAMLLLLVVPLVLAVSAVVTRADDMAGWITTAANAPVPAPPSWLARVPAIGPKLTDQWRQIAATSREDLVTQVAPYAISAGQWFAGQLGSLGLLIVQFLITLLITALLYAKGEQAGGGVIRFAHRLAGARGEQSVVLAGQAIRAVALGIVVTAVVQSVLAGAGLAACGIPYAGVLTSIVFMLCLLQLGPFLVMMPTVVWLYWSGDAWWATALLAWTLVIGVSDNVLRPVLIRRGADLPLPLIIAGAIGGLVGLGLIGLFVGPVILAVTYRLLEWWMADAEPNVEATR